LIKSAPTQNWFQRNITGGRTDTPFFQQAPTDTFRERYMKDNPNAEDEEVQREFNRARLLKMYQPKSTGAK
jgi:hypothetical protein